MPCLYPLEDPGTVGLLVLLCVAGQLVDKFFAVGGLSLVQDSLENLTLILNNKMNFIFKTRLKNNKQDGANLR